MATGLLALVLCTVPAVAQDETVFPAEIARYSVEIILFRYGSGMATGNELFLPDRIPDDELDFDGDVPEFSDLPQAARPAERTVEELGEIDLPAVNVSVQITPRDKLLLGATYDKLELLDAYEPVLWAGWTQDAIDADLSPELPLRRLGNAPADIDGTLKLYLSRFLHLVVDLTLTERSNVMPAMSRELLQAQSVHLRINEDRIMKSGDLRYYDHPKFGLLAKVTRAEQEADKLLEIDNDASPAAR